MLKVKVDDTLGHALLTLGRAETATQEAMREAASERIGRVWRPALAAQATLKADKKMLVSNASQTVGLSSFRLDAANGPALSGGLTPEQWPALEFGMNMKQIYAPNRRKKIRIAGSGREMTTVAKVWVGRNLKPRLKQGYVVMPTIRNYGPTFVAAWVVGLIGQFRGSPLDIKKD